jgi:hypothetical protein
VVFEKAGEKYTGSNEVQASPDGSDHDFARVSSRRGLVAKQRLLRWWEKSKTKSRGMTQKLSLAGSAALRSEADCQPYLFLFTPTILDKSSIPAPSNQLAKWGKDKFINLKVLSGHLSTRPSSQHT